MSEVVIRVENLGKKYQIQHQQERQRYLALRDILAERVKGFFRNPQSAIRNPQSVEDFWALKDVSFEIKRGEVVGIIGRNGAGKSTLLKILSRITEPTDGRVRIRGRVASLLEVGTGFHPELTGRENIYLNGVILGMRKQEIRRKFDEIISFAEIEKFLDTPVKQYSSGMYVRLAFSVAAHLEPEILIVDEVLAVGDAAFQKKCLGRMGEVSKEGRTILFVSHDMGAIKSLTSKCIYLSNGKIQSYSSTEEIVQQYLVDIWGETNTSRPSLQSYHRGSVSESPVHFTRVWVNDAENEIPEIEIGQEFIISAELESAIDIRGAIWAVILKKRDGDPVLTMLSLDQDMRVTLPSGKHIISCTIRNLPLSPGDYLIQMGIDQSIDATAWDVILGYPIFRVSDRNGRVIHWSNRQWGALHWSDIEWNTTS